MDKFIYERISKEEFYPVKYGLLKEFVGDAVTQIKFIKSFHNDMTIWIKYYGFNLEHSNVLNGKFIIQVYSVPMGNREKIKKLIVNDIFPRLKVWLDASVRQIQLTKELWGTIDHGNVFRISRQGEVLNRIY